MVEAATAMAAGVFTIDGLGEFSRRKMETSYWNYIFRILTL